MGWNSESISSILLSHGAVAQLGERLLCKQEVVGSIPISSTNQVTPAPVFRRPLLDRTDETSIRTNSVFIVGAVSLLDIVNRLQS